jgi:hypothetical protein
MQTTIYHSRDWEHLVELGWITVSVDDEREIVPGTFARVAFMLYPPQLRHTYFVR